MLGKLLLVAELVLPGILVLQEIHEDEAGCRLLTVYPCTRSLTRSKERSLKPYVKNKHLSSELIQVTKLPYQAQNICVLKATSLELCAMEKRTVHRWVMRTSSQRSHCKTGMVLSRSLVSATNALHLWDVECPSQPLGACQLGEVLL